MKLKIENNILNNRFEENRHIFQNSCRYKAMLEKIDSKDHIYLALKIDPKCVSNVFCGLYRIQVRMKAILLSI